MTIAKDTTTKVLLASISVALWIIVIRLFVPVQPAVAAPVQASGAGTGSLVATKDGLPGEYRSTVFAMHNGKVSVIYGASGSYKVVETIELK